MNLQNKSSSIAVFGAAGHTGRFVMAELVRRGFAPIAIGRDSAKMALLDSLYRETPIRTASVSDAASLDRSLLGAVAVINCAGPFLDTAQAVVAAALRAGIHYIDVTAEQASAQDTFSSFSRQAAEAGVNVIPAMGFYGGFADLLVTAAMGDWESADEVKVGIALDSWHPTLGTRLTGRRNTARRLVIENGALVELSPPQRPLFWSFPEPFGRQEVSAVPFSEVPLIARHLRVSRLNTFLASAPLRELSDPSTPPPVSADQSGRSAQTFLVEAVVRSAGVESRATARGRDIYAFTAPLVVEALERILTGSVRASGTLAPGEAFDAVDFLRVLSLEHITLELRPGMPLECDLVSELGSAVI
jgi:hypothetical protein